jgi:hypothetical protein
MAYSVAWGKLIHEKTRSKKSHGTVPLSHGLINNIDPKLKCCNLKNLPVFHVGNLNPAL